MKTEKKTGENEISEVRAKFDDILVKEITRLIEVNDESIQAISFNMVTLSCLFLLVDRENDIKKISDNSIERYTKNSLLKEVLEVTGSGQTIDDSIDKGLLEAFEKLTQIGYVNIKNGSYYLQLPAFAVVNFINSLFPDMSGMNLVAFVNQMVDEVLTNRKGLDDGLEQFQKTLKARGVALNNLQKKDFNKQTPDKLPVQNKTDKKKQKNELMKQISSLRSVSKKQIGIPNIITSSYSKKVNIKEVFEKNGYQKNSEESVQNKKIEQVEQKNDVADLENKKADNKAEKLTNHDNILSPDSEENVVDSEKEENVVAPEFAKDIGNVDKPENILTPSVEKDIATQLHIKDEVARLVSEALKKQEIEKKVEIQKVEIQKEEIQKVDEKNIEDKIDEDKIDIEKKIQMFENSIAVTCPVCNQGKISSEATESGKVYYSCSNESCSFISWGKPYPYKCPVCQNPFLIESSSDLSKPPALRCPRTMCSYSQDNINPPVITPSSESYAKPKKKVRRVRRVRKK